VRIRLFSLAIPLLLAGCGSSATDPPHVCTRAGCSSGLEVVLERTPPEPFRVELEVPGTPARFVYRCDEPARCADRVFFADFTPDYVRIRVITGTDTVTQAAQPTYEELRPNGPDCPPTCRVARVRVAVPG
jgi:hypothetical protein